jgi:hypothetical protein
MSVPPQLQPFGLQEAVVVDKQAVAVLEEVAAVLEEVFMEVVVTEVAVTEEAVMEEVVTEEESLAVVVTATLAARLAKVSQAPEMVGSESRLTFGHASLGRRTAYQADTTRRVKPACLEPLVAGRRAALRVPKVAKHPSALTLFKFNGRACAVPCGNASNTTRQRNFNPHRSRSRRRRSEENEKDSGTPVRTPLLMKEIGDVMKLGWEVDAGIEGKTLSGF